MNFSNFRLTVKFLGTFFLLAFFCLPACAQTELTSSEIQTFKQGVSQKSVQIKSLKGNFKQRTQISMLSGANETEGTFFYAAPNRLKWSYQGEDPHSFIFKDDTNKIIVKSRGKSHTVDLSSNKTFKKLSQLITKSLNGKILEDPVFKVTYSQQGKFFVARLVPKEKAMREFYSQLKLSFNPKTYLIANVTLIEPSEDQTTIEFSHLKVNEKITAAVFE